jgi:hypothetical protein
MKAALRSVYEPEPCKALTIYQWANIHLVLNIHEKIILIQLSDSKSSLNQIRQSSMRRITTLTSQKLIILSEQKRLLLVFGVHLVYMWKHLMLMVDEVLRIIRIPALQLTNLMAN